MSGSLRDFSIFYFYREKNDRMTIGEREKASTNACAWENFGLHKKIFRVLKKHTEIKIKLESDSNYNNW